MNPNLAEAYMNLAWVLSETDQTEDAVDAYAHGLHGLFPDHRWRELPQLPCPQRTALLLFFREMTNAEKKRVGRACGLLLPMICVLQLLEHPPDHRCTMCRVKAAHREQYLLEQNATRGAAKRCFHCHLPTLSGGRDQRGLKNDASTLFERDLEER